MRAGSIKPTKFPIPIPHPELFGKTLLGEVAGGATGGTAGAGIGALAALLSKGRFSPKEGATVGAIAGGYPGIMVGAYKGQKHYYKKRGVTINPLMPFSPAKFSEEAKEKYITKFQKKK